MTANATTRWVDFYDILNIPLTADEDRIKEAIRSGRRNWNKRAASPNAETKQTAERMIADLAAAERILLQPASRKGYDAAYGAERSRSQASTAALQPTHGGDWIQRARDFMGIGNAHSANYAAREAIALNGANHEAWSIRANASFMLGNYADAGFEFREAIRLQPQNAMYHFDYGDAMFANGETAAALGEYETALRLDPSNPVYKTAIANLYLANNKSIEALKLMEEVTRDHPGNEFFNYYLAYALHDVTLEKWSRLPNGSFVITSEEQISVTRAMTNRALGLKFDDDRLRASLRENMQLADRAAETIWEHSSNLLWYLGALLVGLIMLFSGEPTMMFIGFLLLGGSIAAYVKRHHKPRWRFSADLPLVRKGV